MNGGRGRGQAEGRGTATAILGELQGGCKGRGASARLGVWGRGKGVQQGRVEPRGDHGAGNGRDMARPAYKLWRVGWGE